MNQVVVNWKIENVFPHSTCFPWLRYPTRKMSSLQDFLLVAEHDKEQARLIAETTAKGQSRWYLRFSQTNKIARGWGEENNIGPGRSISWGIYQWWRSYTSWQSCLLSYCRDQSTPPKVPFSTTSNGFDNLLFWSYWGWRRSYRPGNTPETGKI